MKAPLDAKLTRRDFLRSLGAGAAATVVVQLIPGQQSPAMAWSEKAAAPGPSMLIDLTRCKGCDSCALACKAANNLPNQEAIPSQLSPDSFTFVDKRQVKTADGKTVTRFVKRQCMHCLDASCVSACPAAAMYKSDEGPVIYRPNRCLGCRYCQLACPFDIPRFEWNNGLTPEISKCWLCYQRLEQGEIPACAEACPTGALRFGQRDHLLAQARAQINSNRGRYVDHIYGEFEVGGTSILYISDVPFEDLGFRTGLPTTAPPEETEKIMGALPVVIGGVATLMTGAAAVTHRSELAKTIASRSRPDGQDEPEREQED